MSVIGTGAGMLNIKAPSIMRRPSNPLDKCTIVSVYPRLIIDNKPTIFPGYHEIEAAPKNDFSILVVGTASWFKEMEENQPYLEIQTSSIEVAQAFIRDYVNGLMGSNTNDVMPGLFFIPGEYTKEAIKKWVNPINPEDTFETRLAAAKNKQKRWFEEIVRIADVLWARTSGNPNAISDDARLGALELGLVSKPWLQDFKTVQLNPCPACGELVNLDYPVCKNCKTVTNKKRAAELGIVFAMDLNKK